MTMGQAVGIALVWAGSVVWLGVQVARERRRWRPQRLPRLTETAPTSRLVKPNAAGRLRASLQQGHEYGPH